MGKTGTYYLGLDMGTSSLGWAVTDENYNLLRMKGKDLWGVRLFDEAHTSEKRRTYRIARRRRQREVARLGMLREFFSTEIERVDPGFFARLDDSKYDIAERGEDNKQPFALFADNNYTDRDYYREYPTIFHLRKTLIESDQSHDVRLVYLALANMFKHRGHFLNETLDTQGRSDSFSQAYNELFHRAKEQGICISENPEMELLEHALGEKSWSKKQMAEKICEILDINNKQKQGAALIKLICGFSVRLYDIFGERVIDESNKKVSLSFRSSDYDNMSEDARLLLGDENFELILAAKELHDRGILVGIMGKYEYLSQARVAMYDAHKEDLKRLKAVLKKYDRTAYDEMFRVMQKGNYSDYIGSVNSKGEIVRRRGQERSREELYKTIKGILKKLPQEDEDIRIITEKIEADNFLPKQLTSSNGVIPNQLHEREMRAILNKAKEYLPFLAEEDEAGLSVAEKIVQLFTFTIPYYVGPLGQQYKGKKGYNVWAERKAPGRIFPWNFEEKIDLKTSAERFIERMVKHCTYLSGESALPKQSLLYERYEVLNELNNLRVRGEKITPELKQLIYTGLFEERGKKVTLKQLETFLTANGIIDKNEKDTITGIDGGFHSALLSFGKFKSILGDSMYCDDDREMAEQIIFWATVYGKDKKFLKERITERYGQRLSSEQVKRILGLKFEGWGRLSKRLLLLEGVSKQDGEVRSLIRSLWETNETLMGLLSENYTYRESIEEETDTIQKTLSEWTIEDLDELYVSAPVRRMLWQTLKVVRELEEVIGYGPKRIFVEMAREKGKKGERKESRKQRLLNLYKSAKREEKDWREEIEKQPEQVFQSKKLYLYYMQMQKCMYTGETIRFEDLMNDNIYDIDHIYPRHFVKDDSLENNLVLVKKVKNSDKSDHFPLDSSIQRRMAPLWREMHERGFLGNEKYMRLMRKEAFSEEEKAAFISRQLTETRQGTKVITRILKEAFAESEIVFSRAENVSDFRQKYGLLKVRSINDFHHAQDAYLNIVVGNVYYVKFTRNPLRFIRESQKRPDNAENQYNMDQMFKWTVRRNGETAWTAGGEQGGGTIGTVKKTMKKNTPLITKRSVASYGGITNKGTIRNKKDAEGEGYIPVKMKDPRLADVTKYGGFTTVARSGYTLVEYVAKKKIVRSLEALPVYLGRVEELSDECILEYIRQSIQKEQKGVKIEKLRICKRFIPRNSLIRYNGFYYYLGGKTGVQIILENGVQMKYSLEETEYIKKLEKAVEQDDYGKKKKDGTIIITKEQNEKLYEKFGEKYKNSLFKNQSGVMKNIVLENKDKFLKLSLEEQSQVLTSLVQYFYSRDSANMKKIGGKEQTGKIFINKKITKVDELYLIEQSPTGLFRAETNLLTI